MIRVCSLSRLNETVDACRARHVVTLVRDEARVFRPNGIEPDNHLWLQMDDIADPVDGLIARIAGIFGAHQISLTSVIQKEDVHYGGGLRHAEIVFMTHHAREADVQQALGEIRQLDVVDQIGSVIRVED